MCPRSNILTNNDTVATRDPLARALHKLAGSVHEPRLRRWLQRLADSDREQADETHDDQEDSVERQGEPAR